MLSYYSAWKGRYSGLTPLEVRNRRRHERRKHRAIIAACAAALIVLSIGAADMLIGNPDAAESQESSAAANAPENRLELQPTTPAASATIPVPTPSLERAAATTPALPSPAVQQRSQGVDARSVGPDASTMWVNAADIKKTDPNGYVVQVAAVPDLQEARAVLEQLARAGHHAYLTAKIVDGLELYRVRVGPLESRPVAEEVARRLEREGHRAPWVTK